MPWSDQKRSVFLNSSCTSGFFQLRSGCSFVRVKTAQTTSIALDKVAEGNEYTLTVTGRQSGKTVTVDFQAPARDSSDEKPGDGKNDVIASGKVSNNPKSGVLGNTGAAITIAALAIAMLAAIAMIVKTAKISR